MDVRECVFVDILSVTRECSLPLDCPTRCREMGVCLCMGGYIYVYRRGCVCVWA